MYPEVRLALVVIAAAAALVSGWFAGKAVRANLGVLHGWRRTQGIVRGIAPRNGVEVEIGAAPDLRRVAAPVEHRIGASFLDTVTVYLDPQDPGRARIGGLLQMWLWPASMALLCGFVCLLLIGALAMGRGGAPVDARPDASWRFSPPPEPDPGAIVVRRPESEGKAPLLWSLLGIAAFACGVFAPLGSPFQRLVPLAIGLAFTLGTWGLALYNRTMKVSAGQQGLLATSALGWRQVRWEQIRSVELRETISAQRKPFHQTAELPFPGNMASSIVFADGQGFTLLRMSENMQPPEALRGLIQMCEARTGLHRQLRHITLPEF